MKHRPQGQVGSVVAVCAPVALKRCVQPTVVVPAVRAAEPLGLALRHDRLAAGFLGVEPLLSVVETRRRCLHRQVLGCGGSRPAHPRASGSEAESVEHAPGEDPFRAFPKWHRRLSRPDARHAHTGARFYADVRLRRVHAMCLTISGIMGGVLEFRRVTSSIFGMTPRNSRHMPKIGVR